MSAIFDAYILIVSLCWIGLVLVNVMPLAKRPKASPANPRYRPRTLVIVPCKGTDIELEKNLASLMGGSHDVVAVVDSAGDPAMRAIRRAKVSNIVSSSKCTGCSGKVRAIATAIERMRGYDVYVVSDSDVRNTPDGISALVAPLADRGVGVSTSWQYIKPVGGFWSKVKHVWGFVGNGLMESELTRFAWGGAMAFRRDLLDKRSMQRFKGSVSDDIAITRTVKLKGLKIAYVPNSSLCVLADDDFVSFTEWANRETALSLMGNTRLFRIGALFYGAQMLLTVSGIMLSVLAGYLYLLLLVPAAISIARTYSRSGRRDMEIALITFIMPFIYFSNLMSGRMMRSIVWRGNEYRLR
ncbi:MAG: glycosyltransferase [Candidatus Micrarchaeota archaeon]|nr:glycosyltransferase [Candidatus Micrarchaeota archaeon]